MYLIVDKNGRYLKITTDNKIVFTTNEALADTFNSEREVTDFIRKAFPKKKRRLYKPMNCNNILLPQSNHNDKLNSADEIDNDNESIDFDNCVTAFKETIDTYLTPQIQKYTAQLKKYDGMILDIRHYLRNKDTKLNACQGWKVMVKLQKIERERADCKKELQRVAMLKNSIKKAVKESEQFEYDEYKNREIENVAEYIFSS